MDRWAVAFPRRYIALACAHDAMSNLDSASQAAAVGLLVLPLGDQPLVSATCRQSQPVDALVTNPVVSVYDGGRRLPIAAMVAAPVVFLEFLR